MKTTIISILVCLVCVLQGSRALKCATCVSEKSDEDCKDHMKYLDCRSILNRCQKMYYRTSTYVIWKRGCTAGPNCSPDTRCPITHKGCKIECCTSDNCNTGFTVKAPFILTLFAAIVALAFNV